MTEPKLCKRCNTSPRMRGKRKSGKPYISSYCVECTAYLGKEHRDKRDEANICMSCGGPRDSEQKRCNSCAIRLSLLVSLRYRAGKKAAVEFCGGECVDCGLKTQDIEVYDFHHLDASTKTIGVGYILKSSWDKIVEELKKCILLCANCHRTRERQIDLQRLQQRCNDMGVELPQELKETYQDGNRCASAPQESPRHYPATGCTATAGYSIN